ncbi:MAG: type II secretion system F family protein [Phycisphaeraceae bacterium]|nr:type II secretion system F family protein [Phycisphaeraceae bacterium]MCW5753884.1 type II secretion system F family protein [Phycisphaeraceae bacterium]
MTALCYEFKGVERNGRRRRGVIRAADESDAYRKLSASGVTPLQLKPATERSSLFSRGRITKADIAALTRELSVLVQARIPIAQGLLSIAEHERNIELRKMVHVLAGAIESGQTISEALTKYERVFGRVYIETMKAAEASGNLASVTEHLADMLDRQMESAQQLRRAMTYPAIVIATVVAALGVILTFVVPKFEQMFASNQITLPLATRVVQAAGHFFNAHWPFVLGGLAALIVALRYWIRTVTGRKAAEEVMLRVPYVRKVIVAVAVGRFARVLGIALGSGLSIIDAILLAGRATGRPLFVNECEEIADRLRQGDRLIDAMLESRYLPPFAQRMLGAGRDATELAGAGRLVAAHYEREASHLTKNVSSVIEPLLTVLLAVVVLVVALAVFLPMWEMVKVNR